MKQTSISTHFFSKKDGLGAAQGTRATAGSSPHRISKNQKRDTSKAKQKSRPGDSSDRIMTDVLIAIKPIHLSNIVNQTKNHEYRKYRLRDGVCRLWLYETADGGKGKSSITHIAVIPSSVRREPGSVPLEPFGIGNQDFNEGKKVSKYGYPIQELYQLTHPLTLREMKAEWGMKGAPMGWQYVGSNLWHDRWGNDDAERLKNLKRLF